MKWRDCIGLVLRGAAPRRLRAQRGLAGRRPAAAPSSCSRNGDDVLLELQARHRLPPRRSQRARLRQRRAAQGARERHPRHARHRSRPARPASPPRTRQADRRRRPCGRRSAASCRRRCSTACAGRRPARTRHGLWVGAVGQPRWPAPSCSPSSATAARDAERRPRCRPGRRLGAGAAADAAGGCRAPADAAMLGARLNATAKAMRTKSRRMTPAAAGDDGAPRRAEAGDRTCRRVGPAVWQRAAHRSLVEPRIDPHRRRQDEPAARRRLPDPAADTRRCASRRVQLEPPPRCDQATPTARSRLGRRSGE